MNKVTLRIDSDEWYPVYFVHNSGDAVEVDAAVAERWERVTAEFEEVQSEMRAAWKAANA